MATLRRQQFIHGQIALMTGTILLLSVFDILTLETFFTISLVSFLVLVELTEPSTVTPNWRTRLKWIIFLGVLAFGYVTIKRILEYVPSGVF